MILSLYIIMVLLGLGVIVWNMYLIHQRTDHDPLVVRTMYIVVLLSVAIGMALFPMLLMWFLR
jgi:hypothetical protein